MQENSRSFRDWSKQSQAVPVPGRPGTGPSEWGFESPSPCRLAQVSLVSRSRVTKKDDDGLKARRRPRAPPVTPAPGRRPEPE